MDQQLAQCSIFRHYQQHPHSLKVLCHAVPTEGLAEIEPSMAWNPSVVSGLGLVEDVSTLFGDMHSYLEQSGQRQRLTCTK